MAQVSSWDIHRSGHCFHETGLDAYFSVTGESAVFRSVVGPYSVATHRGVPPSEVLVKSAMRDLVNQLERDVLGTSVFTIFGVAGDCASSSDIVVSVMGVELPFLPNPALRTSLWDGCSKEERSGVFSQEWSIDASENLARHRSGIQFRYAQSGKKINVLGETWAELGPSIVRSLPSLILLEVLAEQGFAYLRDFDERRHFEELVFAPTWFSLKPCQPRVSVA